MAGTGTEKAHLSDRWRKCRVKGLMTMWALKKEPSLDHKVCCLFHHALWRTLRHICPHPVQETVSFNKPVHNFELRCASLLLEITTQRAKVDRDHWNINFNSLFSFFENEEQMLFLVLINGRCPALINAHCSWIPLSNHILLF